MCTSRHLPSMLTAVAMIGLFALLAPASATSGAEALKVFNSDSDKTLEITEVIRAATAVFNHLDPHHDITLKQAQTTGRLTEQDWKRFDTDGNQTLELDEWLKVVSERFNAADANKDGKLTSAELDTPAGQSLLLLMIE
jgi:Ca2+-binding EF-hand superfamily protein